jgi:hypothetical protein
VFRQIQGKSNGEETWHEKRNETQRNEDIKKKNIDDERDSCFPLHNFFFSQSPILTHCFPLAIDYVKNSLSNVAYHVHAVATHLTSLLEHSNTDLDYLESHMKVLSDVCHFDDIWNVSEKKKNSNASSFVFL